MDCFADENALAEKWGVCPPPTTHKWIYSLWRRCDMYATFLQIRIICDYIYTTYIGIYRNIYRVHRIGFLRVSQRSSIIIHIFTRRVFCLLFPIIYYYSFHRMLHYYDHYDYAFIDIDSKMKKAHTCVHVTNQFIDVLPNVYIHPLIFALKNYNNLTYE